MKNLGVMIDENLNFKLHEEYIANRMSKKTHLLSRIRNNIDMNTAMMLFKSLVMPHVEYCASILFNLQKCSIVVYKKFKIEV